MDYVQKYNVICYEEHEAQKANEMKVDNLAQSLSYALYHHCVTYCKDVDVTVESIKEIMDCILWNKYDNADKPQHIYNNKYVCKVSEDGERHGVILEKCRMSNVLTFYDLERYFSLPCHKFTMTVDMSLVIEGSPKGTLSPDIVTLYFDMPEDNKTEQYKVSRHFFNDTYVSDWNQFTHQLIDFFENKVLLKSADTVAEELRKNKLKMVYISHPYRGITGTFREKINNVKSADEIIQKCVNLNDIVMISPIHTFMPLEGQVDDETIMKKCLEMLSMCDEMWVFGTHEISNGCNEEIQYAKTHGIEVKYFSNCDTF